MHRVGVLRAGPPGRTRAQAGSPLGFEVRMLDEASGAAGWHGSSMGLSCIRPTLSALAAKPDLVTLESEWVGPTVREVLQPTGSRGGTPHQKHSGVSLLLRARSAKATIRR
jgi:phosphoribosylaminoimidazole carboxylase (NCAIR synthetase)